MTVEDSIKLFKETYPELTKEEDILTNQIAALFAKKIEEIKPIIDLMKEHRLYFFHPDLNESLKSSHGVILGRNTRNNAELYVADGKVPFLKKVDGYRDQILDEHAIGYPGFFRICDLDFALTGIEFARNYFPTLIENIKDKNSQKRLFLEQNV